MASQAAQAAGKTTRSMFSHWGRRDPELYVIHSTTVLTIGSRRDRDYRVCRIGILCRFKGQNFRTECRIGERWKGNALAE